MPILRRPRPSSLRSRSRRHRPRRFETLETRRVLATFFVNTTDDISTGVCVADDAAASNNCSIRLAISEAESNPGADTIQIPDGTYLISTTQGSFDVLANDPLSLVGNATDPAAVVIDGQNASRLFDIFTPGPAGGVTVPISMTGLTLQNGLANDGSGGAAINASEDVDLALDSLVVRSNAADFNAFLPGDRSSGGAIQTSGNLTIDNSELSDNRATDSGGAIDFTPFGTANKTLIIRDSLLFRNTAGESSIEVGLGGAIYSQGDGLGVVFLDEVTLSENQAGDSGGAIYVQGDAITTTNAVFTNNEALGIQSGGGGLYVFGSGATSPAFSVTGGRFENNTAIAGAGGFESLDAPGTISGTLFELNRVTGTGNTFDEGGGAITVLATIPTSAPRVTLDDVSIIDNSAPAAGGIAAVNANLVIQNSFIEDNNATESLAAAGGIGALGSPGSSPLVITNTSIINNTAAGQAGGLGGQDVNVQIADSIIRGNVASGGRAGGIGIQGQALTPELTIVRSEVSGNSAATDAGGIGLIGTAATITNVTVSGNTASSGNGGGIFGVDTTSQNTQLSFSTVADNQAGNQGSNVFVSSAEFQIESSLFAGGTGAAPLGLLTSLGGNLDDGNTMGFTGTGDLINTNPLIGPLADNGGPVQTHALLAGSPAIDAASQTLIATDARGFARPQDGNADTLAINDIGAFEAEDASPLVELLLNARDEAGNPLVPDANGEFNVTVGDVFFLELGYQDLRSGADQLGVAKFVTDIIASTNGFLIPADPFTINTGSNAIGSDFYNTLVISEFDSDVGFTNVGATGGFSQPTGTAGPVDAISIPVQVAAPVQDLVVSLRPSNNRLNGAGNGSGPAGPDNLAEPLDVNGDLLVTVLDALAVISDLNSTNPTGGLRGDTNQDGVVSPIDALRVINELASRQSSGTEDATTFVSGDGDLILYFEDTPVAQNLIVTDADASITINATAAAVPTLSFADVTVDEGAGVATVDVTLDIATVGPFTVQVQTSDGTATAGADYDQLVQTLSFSGIAGEVQSFSVSIADDDVDEFDETINLALASPSTATIDVNDTGIITITDNDLGGVLVSDLRVSEDAGTVTVTVVNNQAVTGGIEVSVGLDGASPGVDYTDVTRTLNFNGTPGEVQTFDIEILDDDVTEPTEFIDVTISSNTPAVNLIRGGLIVIVDDDESIVSVDPAISIGEGLGPLVAEATLSGDLQFSVPVNINSVQRAFNETATETVDFAVIDASLTLTASVGSTVSADIGIVDDTEIEANETFAVNYSITSSADQPVRIDPNQLAFADIISQNSFSTSSTASQVIIDDSGLNASVVVADGNTIRILSLGTGLTESASFTLPEPIEDIKLVGKTLFVADGLNGLCIFDISEAAFGTITLIGMWQTFAGDVEAVAVAGSVAFIAVDGGTIEALDISNVQDIASLGTVTSGQAIGEVTDMQLRGNRLYVSDDSFGIEIFDVSNPTSSVVSIGSIDTPGSVGGFDVVGDTLYVADGAVGGLAIYDVADPANPALLGSRDTLGEATDVRVEGTVAYLTDGSDRDLIVFDVVDPANIRVLASIDLNLSITSASISLDVDGRTVVVVDPVSGVSELTVDPVARTLVTIVDNDTAAGNVAIDDVATVAEDSGATTIDVLANDSGVVAATTISAIDQTNSSGSVVVAADGRSVAYTPAPDFFGSDSFAYTITDGSGNTSTANVIVTITSVNDAPVAGDDSATTAFQTAVSIDVLDNDVAGPPNELETLTVSAVDTPSSGTAVIDPISGQIVYTPAAGFSGSDSFTYTVSDGSLTATATVSITVTAGQTGLSGHIFCDLNNSGQEDSGEAQPGTLLFLDLDGDRVLDVGEVSTLTDSSGDYTFAGLVNPTGTVVVQIPASCLTIPSNPGIIRSTIGVGDLARSIKSVDIDGDGDRDLLVAADVGGTLSVLTNDGSGTFILDQEIDLGERPQSVAVFESPGLASPSIAVAGVGTAADGGALFILDGTSLSRRVPTGNGPIEVVIDDFDGDGQPDHLTAAFRSSDLQLLLGQSDEPVVLGTTSQIRTVASGDVNGDGHADIVAGGFGYLDGDASEMLVLLGDGTGQFADPIAVELSSRVVSVQIADGDLNRDPDTPSRIYSLAESGVLETFEVASSGELVRLSATSLGEGATSFALGFFDRNDLLDVAIANLGDQRIDLFVGDGDGQFELISSTSDVIAPSSMVVDDFNGDGIDEIAVANLYQDNNAGTASPPDYILPSTATILRLDLAEQPIDVVTGSTEPIDFAFPTSDPTMRFDVTGEGEVTALDALRVINQLATQSLATSEGESIGRQATDVNDDGITSAVDALMVINYLGGQSVAPEAELALPIDGLDNDDDDETRLDEIDAALAGLF